MPRSGHCEAATLDVPCGAPAEVGGGACGAKVPPHEDDLLPLTVVVSAAEDETGVLGYRQNDFIGGITTSSFRFGALPTVLSRSN